MSQVRRGAEVTQDRFERDELTETILLRSRWNSSGCRRADARMRAGRGPGLWDCDVDERVRQSEQVVRVARLTAAVRPASGSKRPPSRIETAIGRNLPLGSNTAHQNKNKEVHPDAMSSPFQIGFTDPLAASCGYIMNIRATTSTVDRLRLFYGC